MQLLFRKHVVKCEIVLTRSVSNSSSNNYQIQNIYVYDEPQNADTKQIRNKYVNRSHTCGELSLKNVGEMVVLCGWLEYQRMNKFLVLRDAYGETQLLLNDKVK